MSVLDFVSTLMSTLDMSVVSSPVPHLRLKVEVFSTESHLLFLLFYKLLLGFHKPLLDVHTHLVYLLGSSEHHKHNGKG